MFRPSETFIYEQAAAFRKFAPILVGGVVGEPTPGHAFDTTTARGAEKLVHSGQGAAVLVHFGVDADIGIRLAKAIGAPCFVVLHGFDVTRSSWSLVRSGRPNLVRYGFTRDRLWSSGAQFLAVSSFIRDQALALGCPSEIVRVHHVGVRVEGGVPERKRSGELPLGLVHVARLVEKKGTSILLDALGLWKQGGGSFRLTVIGDGPMLGSLKAQALRLGIQEVVTFAGRLENRRTRAAIADADVLVLPSVTARSGDAEGLPTVVLEAASVSTAIVATDNGGTADFVHDGESGLLVKQGDPVGLLSALRRLDQSARFRNELAWRANALAREKFDIYRQTAILEGRLERAIEGYPGMGM
ncbi:glycosyltransferase [Modestobacter lapidis]|nr:glycosyltransferase [Modestobacter lapidis]